MSNTLSIRGIRSAAIGRSMDRYQKVLADPYDARVNPSGKLEMGVSEHFIMHEDVAERISNKFRIDPYDISYGDGSAGSQRLRAAMAKVMTTYFKTFKPVTPDQLIITSGLTSANDMLGFTLLDDGDGVLLGRPIYGLFHRDFTIKSRSHMIYVSMEGVDPFSVAASARFEKALLKAKKDGIKVKALLICNPHNPLGRCYPPEALKVYMLLCNKYKIHLISDEIYALSVFDSGDPKAVPFTSVLAINSTNLMDPDYLHVLYGVSKDFAASGLRVGCICTRNLDLQYSLKGISAYHWASGLSAVAAESILTDEVWVSSFIQRSRNRLGANYRHATKLLKAAGIPYYEGSNAGFFLWCDFRSYLPPNLDQFEGERALSQAFLEANVCLATGESFHSELPGWFRIIFTLPRTQLDEGMRRIITVLNDVRAGGLQKKAVPRSVPTSRKRICWENGTDFCDQTTRSTGVLSDG